MKCQLSILVFAAMLRKSTIALIQQQQLLRRGHKSLSIRMSSPAIKNFYSVSEEEFTQAMKEWGQYVSFTFMI
jgi:hypothetical protein